MIEITMEKVKFYTEFEIMEKKGICIQLWEKSIKPYVQKDILVNFTP